ncbi:YncE family protein [Ectobacillus antri]|uniref:YncE family protein n=1 Tax=Ectobacillus antri TaxID=2486280 RepID=A0ABT6H4P2_9BACI|nr:YncE family protein [Ectobacillus antri]MDG4657475.1 YncE family protein [Ectobacillus antri]MDG5753788.1 YncE family protein [Ectobacillus antri]
MKKWLLLICLLAGCSGNHFAPVTQSNLLITSNIKEGSISFIDPKDDKLLTTWKINKAMMGTLLLPDGDTLLLYGKQLDRVYTYSLAKGREIGQWNTGEGIANAVLMGSEVVFANQHNDTVDVYALTGKKTAEIAVGHQPLTMLADQKLYVLNFQDTKMSVVDIETRTVTDTLSIPFSSVGGGIVKDEIWIGGHGNGQEVNESIHIYNTKGMKRSIAAPMMPIGFAVDKDYVYVLSHGSATLRKINRDTYQEEGSVQVGSNPFAVTLTNGRIYVASYDSDEVYVVDPKRMQLTDSIRVGKGPFHFTEGKG